MEEPVIKQQANYRLPTDLVDDIRVQAAYERSRPNEVVERACREYIARRRKRTERREPATASA